MNKFRIFIVFILLLSSYVYGQERPYWVVFGNKSGSTFNPLDYFDSKAIVRRVANNLSLADSTDFPLNETYVKRVSSAVLDTLGQSRWFNALAVMANSEQIGELRKFPFVKIIVPIYSQAQICEENEEVFLNPEQKNLLKMQLERMQGEVFWNNRINGKGKRIAVLDGGFPNVDVHEAFEKMREEERIIKAWDFVKKNDFVYAYSSHGTSVLSNIAGIADEQPMGLATQAEFLLARTEVNTEPFREEVYWMQAMEWADKNGADIISSSLGYTYHRYFPSDMDGQQSLVSKAAVIAARKGILVVTAMGNDGDSSWKTLGAPADADSVLSVGGINPDTDVHIGFSSFGPTADKRRKPNVVAYGKALVAGKIGYSIAHGTSFSTPLVAGFAACAWQCRPNLTAMQILGEIEKSGHLYPYFDYAHGYGVPQAGYFVSGADSVKVKPGFVLFTENNQLKVMLSDTCIPANSFGPDLMYYHIENGDGFVEKYEVLQVFSKVPLEFNCKKFATGQKLVIYYRGYCHSYTF